MRKILCLWMSRYHVVLYVEDELEDGILSVVNETGDRWFLVEKDGTVTDDKGDGDWFGVVKDWDYKGA